MVFWIMILLVGVIVSLTVYKVGKSDHESVWYHRMLKKPSIKSLLQKGGRKFMADAQRFDDEDIENFALDLNKFVDCTIKKEKFKYKDRSKSRRQSFENFLANVAGD